MYDICFYKGEYEARQKQANTDGCVGYVEAHYNYSSELESNYTLVLCGNGDAQGSRKWGRLFAGLIAREFDTALAGEQGVFMGGSPNLVHAQMPAILLKPLFLSNPLHAMWIRNPAGQARQARMLVYSIKQMFPEGGRIGFSVGHRYRPSEPGDEGYPVFGGGTEAAYAEMMLRRAAIMLQSDQTSMAFRQPVFFNSTL